MVALTPALIFALLAGMSVVPAVPPEPESGARTWSIDAAQSQAQFSVRKLLFAHVRGTFPGLSGTLRRSDDGAGTDLVEVDATLEVADLEMDDADDRAHALGANFFDAAQFPSIRFDSDPFPLDELASGGTLRGRLALHGERHPVQLALLRSDCPHRPLTCVIRVRGVIMRSHFGMGAWRGVLSNKVELDLHISLAEPATPH